MSNQPLKQFRSSAAFSVSVAVWPNEKGGLGYQIQKRIKDESAQGGYKEIKTFFANEIVALASLLQQAIAWGDNYQATQPRLGAQVEQQHQAVAQPQAARQGASSISAQSVAALPSVTIDDDIPF